MINQNTTALLLVDLQNDFYPDRALGVKAADQMFPKINLVQEKFANVVASCDWHPADHKSFAANNPGKQPGDRITLRGLDQILWPVHCVQGTQGAEFHPQLNTDKIKKVVHKGTQTDIDSYSAFFDNGHLHHTVMHSYLQKHGINTLYMAGLTTEYCVNYSAIDGINLGYKVYVIVDLCYGVNLQHDDATNAIAEMQHAGVKMVHANDILS